VDETERLSRLINQVLDLFEAGIGGVDWHLEPIELGELVSTCTQATAQLFRDRCVTLEVDLPDPAPWCGPTVIGSCRSW
jgi:signal transduction histidine kinase